MKIYLIMEAGGEYEESYVAPIFWFFGEHDANNIFERLTAISQIGMPLEQTPGYYVKYRNAAKDRAVEYMKILGSDKLDGLDLECGWRLVEVDEFGSH